MSEESKVCFEELCPRYKMEMRTRRYELNYVANIVTSRKYFICIHTWHVAIAMQVGSGMIS